MMHHLPPTSNGPMTPAQLQELLGGRRPTTSGSIGKLRRKQLPKSIRIAGKQKRAATAASNVPRGKAAAPSIGTRPCTAPQHGGGKYVELNFCHSSWATPTAEVRQREKVTELKLALAEKAKRVEELEKRVKQLSEEKSNTEIERLKMSGEAKGWKARYINLVATIRTSSVAARPSWSSQHDVAANEKVSEMLPEHQMTKEAIEEAMETSFTSVLQGRIEELVESSDKYKTRCDTLLQQLKRQGGILKQYKTRMRHMASTFSARSHTQHLLSLEKKVAKSKYTSAGKVPPMDHVGNVQDMSNNDNGFNSKAICDEYVGLQSIASEVESVATLRQLLHKERSSLKQATKHGKHAYQVIYNQDRNLDSKAEQISFLKQEARQLKKDMKKKNQELLKQRIQLKQYAGRHERFNKAMQALAAEANQSGSNNKTQVEKQFNSTPGQQLDNNNTASEERVETDQLCSAKLNNDIKNSCCDEKLGKVFQKQGTSCSKTNSAGKTSRMKLEPTTAPPPTQRGNKDSVFKVALLSLVAENKDVEARAVEYRNQAENLEDENRELEEQVSVLRQQLLKKDAMISELQRSRKNHKSKSVVLRNGDASLSSTQKPTSIKTATGYTTTSRDGTSPSCVPASRMQTGTPSNVSPNRPAAASPHRNSMQVMRNSSVLHSTRTQQDKSGPAKIGVPDLSLYGTSGSGAITVEDEMVADLLFDLKAELDDDNKRIWNAMSSLVNFMSWSRSLTGVSSFGTLCEMVCSEAKRVFKANGATLFILNNERTHLVTNLGEGASNLQYPVSRGIGGYVVSSAEPLSIPNMQQSHTFAHEDNLGHTGAMTRNVIAVPLYNPVGENQSESEQSSGDGESHSSGSQMERSVIGVLVLTNLSSVGVHIGPNVQKNSTTSGKRSSAGQRDAVPSSTSGAKNVNINGAKNTNINGAKNVNINGAKNTNINGPNLIRSSKSDAAPSSDIVTNTSVFPLEVEILVQLFAVQISPVLFQQCINQGKQVVEERCTKILHALPSLHTNFVESAPLVPFQFVHRLEDSIREVCKVAHVVAYLTDYSSGPQLWYSEGSYLDERYGPNGKTLNTVVKHAPLVSYGSVAAQTVMTGVAQKLENSYLSEFFNGNVDISVGVRGCPMVCVPIHKPKVCFLDSPLCSGSSPAIAMGCVEIAIPPAIDLNELRQTMDLITKLAQLLLSQVAPSIDTMWQVIDSHKRMPQETTKSLTNQSARSLTPMVFGRTPSTMILGKATALKSKRQQTQQSLSSPEVNFHHARQLRIQEQITLINSLEEKVVNQSVVIKQLERKLAQKKSQVVETLCEGEEEE